MTIVPLDATGLSLAAAALRDGEAIVLPFPSPLPYAVAAAQRSTVNHAKGRPSDQPCGILVSSAQDIAPHLDLGPETLALSLWIAQAERVNLFVPLRPSAPRWLGSGSVNGVVGITLAWLKQTRPLADEFGHLFVSSANPTSQPAGVTPAAVDAMFDGRRLVLDGEPFRDGGTLHGSATIIEVGRSGELRVVRDGIHNRSLGADRDGYLESLRGRFAASSPG